MLFLFLWGWSFGQVIQLHVWDKCVIGVWSSFIVDVGVFKFAIARRIFSGSDYFGRLWANVVRKILVDLGAVARHQSLK